MKTIVINGIIGGYQNDINGEFVLDANWLRNQIKDEKEIRIELASPGGYMYDGFEMFNVLKNYTGDLSIHLMGVVASMAAYLSLCTKKKKRTAEKNAIFMIHNPMSLTVGDYRDHEKQAEILKGLRNLISQKYSEETGKTTEEINKLLDNETYFFGEEIKEMGFVSEIIESDTKEDKPAAIAKANLAVKNCAEKMEATKIKEDFNKLSNYLNLIEPVSGVINSVKTHNINKEVKRMTPEEIKAQHPDAYNTIFNAGKEHETKRVTAHLTMGKAINDYEMSLKNIVENKSIHDEDVFANYKAAEFKMKALDLRLQDNPPPVPVDNKDKQASIEAEINKRVANSLGIKEVK